ncbi:unnamed protein product [Sphagnum troendelagicum]|uniref:Uncharacterized protein n=1 Tax=Sphagnum troendelagicum TaxID=128251 RepID=A0ABP0UE66_9BRYO
MASPPPLGGEVSGYNPYLVRTGSVGQTGTGDYADSNNSKVSGYNPYLVRTGSVGQTGTGDYADSNNSIHPRHLSSHRLWASEIPFVESPVMSG